jgi:hypothetical protein
LDDVRQGTKDKERTMKNIAGAKKGYKRNLAGGEVLEKVVVHDGLLDEGLGPEVLAVLLCVGGEGGGDALAGHSLLLAQCQLSRHAVRILHQNSLLRDSILERKVKLSYFPLN